MAAMAASIPFLLELNKSSLKMSRTAFPPQRFGRFDSAAYKVLKHRC